MDGRFVPNITIGPLVVRAVRTGDQAAARRPPDDRRARALRRRRSPAPAPTSISVHVEACAAPAPHGRSRSSALGKRASVALNPHTPLDEPATRAPDVDGAADDGEPRLRRAALHPGGGAQDPRAARGDRRAAGSTSTSRSTAASRPTRRRSSCAPAPTCSWRARRCSRRPAKTTRRRSPSCAEGRRARARSPCERSEPKEISAPWWARNPHIQTTWGRLGRSRRLVTFRREVLTTPDDDDLVLDHVDGPAGSPRVLLLHGLEGSSYSVYMQGLAQLVARAGWQATALNFRSCARDPERISRTLPNRRHGSIIGRHRRSRLRRAHARRARAVGDAVRGRACRWAATCC